MRKVAIVENGIVTNLIAVALGKDGDKEIQTRSGLEVTGEKVSIGWHYDGKNFNAPEPTEDELAQIAKNQEKDAKIQSAKDKLLALGLSPEEIAAITGEN